MMDRKFIEEFDKKQKSKKHRHKRGREDSDPRQHGSSSSSSAKHGKPSKQFKKENTEEIAHQPSNQYRDRAQERREGLNKDFQIDPDDLIISNPTVPGSSNPIAYDNYSRQEDADDYLEEERERRLQQIEESKYLGGDVEHTHLVKGLDFALLEKIKKDQKLAEKQAEEGIKDGRNLLADNPNSDSDEEEFRTNAILAASLATSIHNLLDIEKLKKGRSTEIIHCRTAKARRILNVLDEKWPDKSELFLPGRMNYIIPIVQPDDDYNLNHAGGITTVLRSKADTSAAVDAATGLEGDPAFDRLIDFFTNIRKRTQESKTGANIEKKMKTSLAEADEMNEYDY